MDYIKCSFFTGNLKLASLVIWLHTTEYCKRYVTLRFKPSVLSSNLFRTFALNMFLFPEPTKLSPNGKNHLYSYTPRTRTPQSKAFTVQSTMCSTYKNYSVSLRTIALNIELQPLRNLLQLEYLWWSSLHIFRLGTDNAPFEPVSCSWCDRYSS